jgi:hypothetical protein
MTPRSAFENLCGPGKPLKAEPPSAREFASLVHSGSTRLNDARNSHLALESRFDLGYNAAHALSLAALRWHGYRPVHRYVVFQILSHSLNLGPEVWRVLSKCHDLRNLAEYEGHLEIDERIVAGLLSAADSVLSSVNALAPIAEG